MVRRHELTDEAWTKIAPLLPPDPRREQPWRDRRTVLDGILWKLSTGVPWRNLPERYVPWQTYHSRLLRWKRDGTWERPLGVVQQPSDAVGRDRPAGERGQHHRAGAPARGGRPGKVGTPAD